MDDALLPLIEQFQQGALQCSHAGGFQALALRADLHIDLPFAGNAALLHAQRIGVGIDEKYFQLRRGKLQGREPLLELAAQARVVADIDFDGEWCLCGKQLTLAVA